MTIQPVVRHPSRRTVLRGAIVVPVAVAVGASLVACDTGPDDAQAQAEMLVRHAREASVQQESAQALAPRLTQYTAALTVVAAERAAHAKALRDEIDRLHSSSAATLDEPGKPLTTLDALRGALGSSARAAATDAVASEGFIAGLLASTSASCTTLEKVQLA